MSIVVYYSSQGRVVLDVCHIDLGKIGIGRCPHAELEGVLVYGTREGQFE